MDNYDTIINLIKQNRRICFFHGKKYLIQKTYQERTGQKLNLDTPSTFREKLQLRKLTTNPLITKCADKYTVRDYVKNKIGAKYLIPQYFCHKHISPKELTSLPNSFAIKTTSGSGANIIIKDKTKANLAEICQKMNSYTKIKYGYLWGEFFYNKTNNQIIAEKLLTKNEVYDYKIHCFRDDKDKLRQIIEVMWGPKSNRHKSMYDSNWQPLHYYFSIPPDGHTFKKPQQLAELLKLSDKLSEDFKYVRVDFYIIKNQIYFGELTFVPTAGFNPFHPAKYDQIWGSWIGDFSQENPKMV